MYPHAIRLRGPWEYQTSQARGRLTLPAALADTPLSSHPGEVLFMRRFGYPGRIDSVERVWLCLSAPAMPMVVSLNGERLSECAGDCEWDVTERLRARNELHIATLATTGVPWREVYLEVRRTAFVRGLRVSVEGGVLRASGEVIGTAEGPLDLYLVADRRTAAYITLNASLSGTPFALMGEEEFRAGPVKVELVQGAVAWHTTEIEIGQG